MRKVLLFVALGLTIMSCDKPAEAAKNEAKTAYVDSAKLVDEATEAKDIEAKYKGLGEKLEQEIAKFQSDRDAFQKEAQVKGMQWAQQNASTLQQRQQMISMQQQKLREESNTEMDSMISAMKKLIKGYGKEHGYAYIYEASAVLYTDEKNDITKDIIKLVNDKYKSGDKTTEEKK